MYSNIEKILINKHEYYIHKEILQQYHFLDVILQKRFKEQSIDITINTTLDFNAVLHNLAMSYYKCSNQSEILSKMEFDDFLNLLEIINYLQPKNQSDITELIDKYNMEKEIPNKIQDIINSNLAKHDKKYLLEKHIKKINKIELCSEIDDKSIISSDDQYYLKMDNISLFFNQFDIIINNYEIPLNIIGVYDWYHMEFKDIEWDYSYYWFYNGSRMWYHAALGCKFIKIDNKELEFKNCAADLKDNVIIDLTYTLITFLIDEYLLK